MAKKALDLTYKASGVDVDAASQAMVLAQRDIRSTYGKAIVIPAGFFTGGMLVPDWVRKMKRPILIANSDGIGTLTHEAMAGPKYMARMGYSVANHNFMDLVASGGCPVAFLNTMDWQKVDPLLQAAALKWMARSCREVGAAILGGETASLAILIQQGEMIMNGTAIGYVDQCNIINGHERIKVGDIIIGVSSN
ncbi:hypothetical protein HY065_00915, partial [Candidatus Berkelbacteria bacterium]|nr:hypothetical protein [Candidatus Berkelbacteria bacterium]